MDNQNVAKTAVFANIIEIGKQALLNSGSSDFAVPGPDVTGGRSAGDYTAELLASALQSALQERAMKGGVA